ncbi:Kinase-like protein [Mycena sanguinolenta]|uniref:Kinase-like protein n=1 Tax=Mycena sanguinolenta TaxID=230812 RepID=A0A8H7DF84_9AGAR|nr:Kinase-like protein [Mycena sanguinolenta]
MNEDTMTSPRILIYEASLSFLKGACGAQSPAYRSLNEVELLRMTVDDCISSMTSNSAVAAIVESLECRKRVLQLSTKLELTNDAKLRTAIRVDEERMATLLVSILSSESDEDAVLRLEGVSAQNFLDVVQETLDRGFIVAQAHAKMARRIIRKLSESCDRLPSSLFVVGVEGRDEHPTSGGGFGDIYRASYCGQRVALKRMRYFLHSSDLRRIRSKFCREALLWKNLHHPHILPFLGIDADSFPGFLSMVSLWMEHGTVINYLKTYGFANVDKLLYEIAQGLAYLHSHNIVHGDLRGSNILIKEDWTACLNDFGLSIFSDATATISTNRAGSLYWMAPELLDPDRFNLKFERTPATDVYAFGCVCVELYTTRPPFSDVSETAALLKVLNGERPKRPPGPPTMSDMLWENVTRFWAQNHAARPSTQSVVRSMFWPNPDSHGGKSDQKGGGGGLREASHITTQDIEHFAEISGKFFSESMVQRIQAGIGSDGGSGGSEGSMGQVLEFLGRVPRISIGEFCRKFHVNEEIRKLLEEEGFETARALLELTDAELRRVGFKDGQIAELERALKELLTAGLPGNPDSADGGHTSSHMLIKIPYPLETDEVQIASRRGIHLWQGRDAASVGHQPQKPSKAGSVISSYARTVIGSGPRLPPDEDHHIICHGCGNNIVGTRYQCANCPSQPQGFSLCKECEEHSYTIHDPSHIFFKLQRPVQRPLISPYAFLPRLYKSPAGPPPGMDPRTYLTTLEHSAAVCDRCMLRIQGVWFRCAYCGVDFCDACEAVDKHNDLHCFIVFKSPVDMLAFIAFAPRAIENPPPAIPYPVYR